MPVHEASLEHLVLQRHVRFWLETNTSAEDVSQGPTLLGQGIDNWRAWRGQRSLRASVTV